MSLAEEKRARFNALFDEVLGSKTGTTRKNYTDASITPAVYGSIKKYSNTKSGSSKKQTAPAVDPKVLLKNNEPKSKSVLEDIWSTLSKPKEGLAKAGDALTRGIDLISRPGYAVSSGLLEVQKSINAGEPFWSLGDDLAWGAKQGVTGARKSGFGDVVEEATKYNPEGRSWTNKIAAGILPGLDNPAGGQVIGEMAKNNPTEATWLKRTLGATGDVGLDPTNYVTFGVKTLAKDAGAMTAKEIMQEAGTDAVKRVVKREVTSAVKNNPIASVTKPTRSTLGTITGKTNAGLADDVVNEALDSVDKLLYDVASGAQKGKVIGSLKETGGTLAYAASERVRSIRVGQVEKVAKQFEAGLASGGPGFTAARLAKEKKANPLFKLWHDTYTGAVSRRITPTKASERAYEAVGRELDPETLEIFTKIHSGLQDATMRVPTIRLMGKDVAYSKHVGEALSKMGKAVGDSRFNNFQKAFQYSSEFPGYSSMIAQKARSLGNIRFNEVRRKLLTLSRETTKEDRKALQKALEGGYSLPGRLGQIQQELRNTYDEMFARELAAGLRKSKDQVNDYTYVYLKGKEVPRKSFAAARKESAKRTKTLAGYTSEEAKALGLNPEEDAFTNLLMRQVKHNRKMTRSHFSTDLVSHYGIRTSNLNRSEALAKGLVDSTDLVDATVKNTLKKGERLYLSGDIRQVFDKYVALSKVGSEESAKVLRSIDWVTRKFKTGNTLYWPGFHIRNFISDAYMGALDGVNPKEYAQVIKGWSNKASGATLDVGGETMSFSKLLDSYDRNAASGGFASTEVHNATKRELTGEGVAAHLKHPTSWPGAVRRGSEHREDFGRFTHFYHAMKEEYPAALKKFNGDKAKAYDAAINASVFRVNKYKFDYGALTKTEQQVMRRGMPFYTYMRKAIPTLVESMALSPRNLVMTNKVFNTMVPDGKDRWDAPVLPDYLENMGFAQIAGGEEPWGIGGGMLPQDVFNNTFNNPAANLNPLIKAPFEIQSGKDTFSGKPVNNLADLLGNNFRGKAMYDKMNKSSSEVTLQEKLASVLGIPLVHVTKEKQDNQINNLRYQLNDRIKELDTKAKDLGYHIYLTSKNEIRMVQVDADGKALTTPKVFATLEEAQAALKL